MNLTTSSSSSSSSIGSDIFALVALLCVSSGVLFLLRHFLPLRSTPAYLLVPVFLALALPTSIVLLVPIDLASATDLESSSTKGVWLPEKVVLVTWRITYWLTFVLTWFILPLLGEFVDSGDRDVNARFMYSLRRNARYNLVMLGIGITGLVYFILQNGLHGSSIKGLLMALAYAWGLILAIGLMGHGLVALPRRLYRNANVGTRLRQLQACAPKIKDKLDEAVDELAGLEDTVVQLKARKHGCPRDLQDWIDELADTTSTQFDERPGAATAVRATGVNMPAVLTERYLADLTRKLKRARHKKARFVDEWRQLCQSVQDAQAILDSAASKKLDFGRDPASGQTLLGRLSFMTPSMRYHLHMHGIPALRIGLSGLLGVASIMVVWSEIIKGFKPEISFVSLTVIHHPGSESGKIGFAGQVIAMAWLVFMDLCALYAISDVKVWGNRALVRRQTYGESATWYSLQVAKLTVPLSYNFVTMLPKDVFEKTQFFGFLGQLINLTPLGAGFSRFFPCFILVPVLLTAFNVYGRITKIIGIGVLQDESDENLTGFGPGGWREGRALIERGIQSQGDGLSGGVGLSVRGGSLDLERRAGTGPAGTSTPPRDRQARARGVQALPAHPQNANRQFNSITNREAPDESARHFYQDFGERVRNTFDTVDTPQWMKNIGAAFKTTPKWMQNDQRDDQGGSAISRWFGGRSEDGRLRL